MNTEQILTTELQQTVVNIQDGLAKQLPKYGSENYTSNTNATGKLSANTFQTVEPTSFGFSAKIWSFDYITWASNGRGATKNSGDGALKDKILQWLEDKPVPLGTFKTREQQAFVYTRKIHRKGTNRDFSEVLKLLDPVADKVAAKMLSNYVELIMQWK